MTVDGGHTDLEALEVIGQCSMPFGKWKGTYVFDVLPDNYLIWLRANVELREPLKTHVFPMNWKSGAYYLTSPRTSGGRTLAQVKTSLSRFLSLRFHPDRGGNVEAQKGD